jgi:rhamnogalacturonan endolyase
MVALVLLTVESRAQRQMENLNRGLVAVNQGDGSVFLGWRMFGTDPDAIAFNVYRSVNGGAPTKLNATPITDITSFVDKGAQLTQPTTYSVRAVIAGAEQVGRDEFKFPANPPARPYLPVPIEPPPNGTNPDGTEYTYSANDCSVGDVDGDGEYEIILKWDPSNAHDNSQSGYTGNVFLDAYKLNGMRLWRIDLGRNIRAGAHYTQFMVYDLDGDGRAEVACKTADGTVDAKGKVIGDAKADHRNQNGYVLAGPEFLTVFDGLTGAELATTKYIPPRHPQTEDPTPEQLKEVWGDAYGNRVDRFLACVAYLDGVRPSLVMCRGYYTRTVLAAWNWRDGKLTNVWTFDSDDPAHPENKKFAGQGNHNLSVADVDGDGKDEIIYGGMAIDNDGKGLYSTGLGHGDAIHISDLDPDRPGLEVFRIQERFDDAGDHMFDAKTGEILWKKPSVTKQVDKKVEGPGRGLALDIDPRHKGYECWSAGAGITGLFDCKGNVISEKNPGACNFGVWWDGDLLTEILDKNWIAKWNWETNTLDRILTADGCASNNGTKATPCLSADILGDWREEVIWRTNDSKELRIYTTTIPTKYRFYTLMHDPQYRLSIAWQNVAYNQPPHTSFYLGDGMAKPPKPKIVTIHAAGKK